MPAGKLQLVARASNPKSNGYGGRKAVTLNVTSSKRGKGKSKHNKAYDSVSIKRNVCPTQIVVPLRYVSEAINIACTTGSDNYHLFNFNNMYDPDRTGTGHQCLGWDQWSAFYNIYRVLSAKVKVIAVNQTDNTPFHLALNFAGSTSGATNIDASAEGRGKSRYGGDQQRPLTVSAYRKGHTVFGVEKMVYRTDDLYRALVTTAPSKEGIIQIWVQPFDETTTTNIKFKAEITYYVMFSNPKLLTQS